MATALPFTHSALSISFANPATGTTFGSSLVPGSSTGSLRLDFDAATRVITASYDVDSSNGQNWVMFSSYGIDGSDGLTANTDWGITNSSSFTAALSFHSEFVNVTSGDVYLDNFQAVPEPSALVLICVLGGSAASLGRSFMRGRVIRLC